MIQLTPAFPYPEYAPALAFIDSASAFPTRTMASASACPIFRIRSASARATSSVSVRLPSAGQDKNHFMK